MKSDIALYARSSLLSLPTEVLQGILALAVYGSPLPVNSDRPRARNFEAFYLNRRANQESVYRIRFVCKRIDQAIVKYLFREVTIRLGWNRLSINPPLRELTNGAMGHVFRENARVLTLDRSLLPNPPWFEDDRHRDHHYNWYLPTEVWYHYPKPMSKDEKVEKHEELMDEARDTISTAIASMSKLVEIRYEMDMRSSSQWLGTAFLKGLSASSTIETLIIRAQVQRQDIGSEEAPLGKHLQPIGALKNLHTFEFSTSSECDLRNGLDGFWQTLQAAGIHLRSISVDSICPSLLEYLASFTGLHRLFLTRLQSNNKDQSNDQERMASFLFKKVLVRHSQTLSHLAIVGDGCWWCLSHHNISALAHCRLLASLTTPLCVLDQHIDADIRASLELLLELIQTLPSLNQTVLKLTASDQYGLHSLTIAKPSLSVHKAITSIEHHEVSLVPEVLTIEYGIPSQRVEYRLIEVRVCSSARAWRYYAEKPEWLGVNRSFRCGGGRGGMPEWLSQQIEQEQRDRIAGR